MKTLVKEIEARVARAGTDPIWGYNHCRRVYALSRELARLEQLSHDSELLYMSALLHDIGLYKAYSHRREPDHAQRSVAVTEQLLHDAKLPDRNIRIVLDAIEHHPPGAPAGASAEAALLKDAVALDYLGVLGISRVLAMVGTEEDVPDFATAIRHSESLHESIPGLLIFESSKEIARDRAKEKDQFMQGLLESTADLRLL